jgi:hypothetical protein
LLIYIVIANIIIIAYIFVIASIFVIANTRIFVLANIFVIPSFLPSFPSALQLKVSFGLLNNLPPFFSILHLSSPSFHFHFTEIIMYILQPSQLLR